MDSGRNSTVPRRARPDAIPLAYHGTGPKAGRVGRHLRYLPADVMAWFREQQQAA